MQGIQGAKELGMQGIQSAVDPGCQGAWGAGDLECNRSRLQRSRVRGIWGAEPEHLERRARGSGLVCAGVMNGRVHSPRSCLCRSGGAQVHSPVLAPELRIAQRGCPMLSGLDNRAHNVNSFPGTAWHSAPGWPGQGNPTRSSSIITLWVTAGVVASKSDG